MINLSPQLLAQIRQMMGQEDQISEAAQPQISPVPDPEPFNPQIEGLLSQQFPQAAPTPELPSGGDFNPQQAFQQGQQRVAQASGSQGVQPQQSSSSAFGK